MTSSDLHDQASVGDGEVDESNLHKYVVFEIGRELYGTQLLSVREVVEELPIKSLPNTVEACRGVCNLRGQIVGVIDFARLFNIPSEVVDRPVMLVFDSDNGALAAAVGAIKEVSVIAPGDIDDSNGVMIGGDRRYIRGIGKLRDRLVTLIDLRAALAQQKLHEITNSRIMPKEDAA